MTLYNTEQWAGTSYAVQSSMKMNNPVASQSFFRDQIQHNREGLWCVTLGLSGQILGLVEVHLKPETVFSNFNKTLREQLRQPHASQLLITRLDNKSAFFDGSDWELIEMFKTMAQQEDIYFCDYLKLNRDHLMSLIKHELVSF